MSIYSNDNIRKIAKLTTRELPQKSKIAKITVRENNGLYSNTRERAKQASAPETHIFMPQKCDISVWPTVLQLPLLLLLMFTVYIILLV